MAATRRSTRLATGMRSPTTSVFILETPFPSPTGSVGSPTIVHRAGQEPLLAVARQGPAIRDGGTTPIGFHNSRVQCYLNASLVVLMNLTPFVGFLDQIYEVDIPHSGPQGAVDRDVLAHLKSIAAAYWATPTRQRQQHVNSVANAFKTWFLRVIDAINEDALFLGTNPFSPATKPAAEEDASDSLDKILEIADYNLGMRPKEATVLAALTLPVLTLRRACGQSGDGCQTNARIRPSHKFSTSHQRLLTIDIPLYAPNTQSIEDCIDHVMNRQQNQFECELCRGGLSQAELNNSKRAINPGREWHRLRDAPEILFIKLARLKQTDSSKEYSVTKSLEEIVINETLDLSQYLEQDDKDAGLSTRYRLDGIISHAGSGISGGHYVAHVRHHAEPTRWFALNDSSVCEETFADATAHKLKFRSHYFTPYVLAYTKIHNEIDVSIEQPTSTKPGPIKTTDGSKKPSPGRDTGKKHTTSTPRPLTPLPTRSSGHGVPPNRSYSLHELATLNTTLFASNTCIHADTRDVMLDLDTSSDPVMSAQFSLAFADGTTYAFIPKRGKNEGEMVARVNLTPAKPATSTAKTPIPPTPDSAARTGGKDTKVNGNVSKDTRSPKSGPFHTVRGKSGSAESESSAIRTSTRKPKPLTGESKTRQSASRLTGSKASKRKADVVYLTSDEGAKTGRKKGDVVGLTNEDAADDGARKGRKKRRIA